MIVRPMSDDMFTDEDHRLIEAAPDLLAALKESRKENEELRGRNDAAISELSKILEWRDYGTLSMRLSKIVNALEGKQ